MYQNSKSTGKQCIQAVLSATEWITPFTRVINPRNDSPGKHVDLNQPHGFAFNSRRDFTARCHQNVDTPADPSLGSQLPSTTISLGHWSTLVVYVVL
jgi:hypothetical protein